MNRRRWYYKNGTCFEEFDILFDNGRFMLVQNVETKVFSFGVCENFGTLYGFPVNWSCLTKDQAIERLNNMIRIDTRTRCSTWRSAIPICEFWRSATTPL